MLSARRSTASGARSDLRLAENAFKHGDLVRVDLTVRARAALLVWPLFAVIPVLLGSSLGRDPETEEPEPEP